MILETRVLARKEGIRTVIEEGILMVVGGSNAHQQAHNRRGEDIPGRNREDEKTEQPRSELTLSVKCGGGGVTGAA